MSVAGSVMLSFVSLVCSSLLASVLCHKRQPNNTTRRFPVFRSRLPHKASGEFSAMRVAHIGALEARRKLLMHAQPSWLRVVPVTDKLA